jgi:hypothetical protein
MNKTIRFKKRWDDTGTILVIRDSGKEDQWANADYFYFFLSSPCKMGGKAAKPKTVTVTETSGFKEEDRSWSIINIHLSCAINTVISLCAVIFVICILAFIIQRIVQRYCKRATTQDPDATLPSSTTASWSAKQIRLCRPLPFPRQQCGPLHQLLGAAAKQGDPAPTPAGTGACSSACRLAASPPAVLPPALPGQLNHPIPA